ncbi:MAG: phosphotriesterase-related protein [Candidatus Dormibacteraeota bacterium]|nr:phosphotriesterase-related protein [Candidatus Dormibacteraeota bacterium]
MGVTLAHEHLLLDLSCLWHEPASPDRRWLVDAPVALELHDALNADPYHSRDNLRLDDFEEALSDLQAFRLAGGRSLIDLSSRTIGPFPAGLRALAERSGVQVVAGTGFYVKAAHPPWLSDAAQERIEEEMLRDLLDGFDGTGVRAGVIGELGTSSPVHPDEEKVLRAAAKVQARTGVGINVHLTLFASEGEAVLRVLELAGADLTRVALSHLDETLEHGYHRKLAERGCFLEFDTWGSECQFTDRGLREPTDRERLEALERLAGEGFLGQILLSQDVCTKMQRRANGGRGYDHLLTRVVPCLVRRGFSDSDLRMLLVDNPARFLTGPAGNGPGREEP